MSGKKRKKRVELDNHFTPQKKPQKNHTEKKNIFEFTGFVPRAKDNDSQRSKYEKCSISVWQFKGPGKHSVYRSNIVSAQLSLAAFSGSNPNMRKGPPWSTFKKGFISALCDVTQGPDASLVQFIGLFSLGTALLSSYIWALQTCWRCTSTED